jgi:membrane protein
MIKSSWNKHFFHFRKEVIRKANGIHGHIRGWVGILTGAAKETLKPEASVTAAAIAYFSLFSLFPFTLLIISIASLGLDSPLDYQIIIRRLEFIAPAMGSLLGRNIDEIVEARGPVSGFALVGLVWSASTVFYTLTNALNGIWNIKQRRPSWKRRGLAILFVLILVGPILILTSSAGSLLSHFSELLPASIVLIANTFSWVLAILLDIALFMVLYMSFPHGDSTWRGILPGAMGAGVLWELAKRFFLVVLSSYVSLSNLVYGSLAAIIAFLVWAYVSGIIFIFGACISVSYIQFNHQKKEMDEVQAGKKEIWDS